MSPELIKLIKKVDSVRNVLEVHGFDELEYFWYRDGYYSSNWNNMSVANEQPDEEVHMSSWEFGFKSSKKDNRRIKLEALVPVAEDYFRFVLRFYPEVRLHDRTGYLGPTAVLEVSDILERDLKDLQKYINYLLNIA